MHSLEQTFGLSQSYLDYLGHFLWIKQKGPISPNGEVGKGVGAAGQAGPHHSFWLEPQSLEGQKKWTFMESCLHPGASEASRMAQGLAVERKKFVSGKVACSHAEGVLGRGSL